MQCHSACTAAERSDPGVTRLTLECHSGDGGVTTSTFSADKVRYFATAEIYYSLVDPDGAPVSTGVMSMSTTPTELETKSLKGAPYSKAN